MSDNTEDRTTQSEAYTEAIPGTRRQQLQVLVDILEKDGLGQENLSRVSQLATSYGIVPNMHTGNDTSFFGQKKETRTPEWLMGQFISLSEEEGFVAFIALQTALNLSHTFLEGTY